MKEHRAETTNGMPVARTEASVAATSELHRRFPDAREWMSRGVLVDPDTGLEYFTGYAYQTLYDWDQYFEGLALVHMGWPSKYLKNAVRIFLAHQRADGFIARSVPSTPTHDDEHVKPFLAQIAHLVVQAYGQTDWLQKDDLLPKLKAYLDYWLIEMDSTASGLSDWMSAPHSGMDNQHERAGYWKDRVSQGVDLNCYLVRECRAFADLQRRIGCPDLAGRYEAEADSRGQRIRDRLWDHETGFFYDGNLRASTSPFCRSAPRGSQLWNPRKDPLVRVRSVSAFATLWTRVASPDQAQRLVQEHLSSPSGFATPFPAPTLACGEPWYDTRLLPSDIGCGWRANTWIPTNFMLAQGLRAYGFDTHAKNIETATRRLVEDAGLREYYCAQTGEGRGLGPFWGWTLLAFFIDQNDFSGEVVSPNISLMKH